MTPLDSSFAILVGFPRAGKTSLAAKLAERSYSVVSVGAAIRAMFLEESGWPGKRLELIQFGISLREKDKFRSLTKLLDDQISCSRQKTVLEGLRPIELIRRFKSVYQGTVFLVCCDEEIIRQRLAKEEPEDGQYSETVLASEKELIGGSYSAVSDATVQGGDKTRYSWDDLLASSSS